MFKWLKRKKLDICCLVDTHCKNEAGEEIKWSNQWGYKGFFSSFNSQSRGIAVLFNNTFEYKLHAPPVNDPEGRFCILDLTLFQQRFTLAVVYGPNNDDPNFFLQLSEKIGAVGNEAVIAVGDWNVVLDYEWDTVGYKHKNNPKANAAVLDLMKILDLGDIYRTLHPDKHRFTWRKGRKESQMSRLDYFLISPDGFVTEADIDISYRSDHSLITVDLNFITQERGKGYWKFNNSLLYDPEYVKKVKEQ